MDNFLHIRQLNSYFGKLAFTLTCVLGLLVLTSSYSHAQSCGCQDQVNIQLDDDCQFILTVDNVQAGSCGDNLTIIVDDDDTSNGNIVDCAGLHNYGIFDAQNNLLCWGRVLAEDKAGPEVTNVVDRFDDIECYYIDVLMNNPASIDPNNDLYIGEVIFEDNCSACGCFIDRKFYDEIDYTNCDDSDVVAVMTRRWTGTDCEGNQTIAEQTFNFFRPDLGDLITLDDQLIQTCSPNSVSEVPDYFPHWIDVFGEKLSLDKVTCNYSANVTENKFVVCDDGSFKLERTIRVLDWCSGSSVVADNYVVKVGDFEAPQVTKSGNKPGNSTTISIEDDRSILTILRDSFDLQSFEALNDMDMLPMVSTDGSRSCSASFFLNEAGIESVFGVNITDCSALDINAAIYSYGQEIIFGFPTGDAEWRTTNYPMINGVASGVPVGLHALVLEIDDNCKNPATVVILFKVKDKTPPVMICDDQLNVSVTTGNSPFFPNIGAYARVDADQVDEGSFDNCELDKILVRRSVPDLGDCQDAFIELGYDGNRDGVIDARDWYDENGNGIFDSELEYKWELVDGVWRTPWREFVEFFCCDVDQSVVIELRGWDNAEDPLTGMEMPNFNTCWLEVVIEDDIDPVLEPLPDATIDCDDPFFAALIDGTYTDENSSAFLEELRAKFGTAWVSGTTCGATVLEETIVSFLDNNCPRGFFERRIRAVKTTDSKGTSETTIVQRIEVLTKHNYWVCFPADVTRECTDPTGDIPGVTVGEGDCDLIAVGQPFDERFDTDPDNPNNGCYKIFRTYSVINWCEYDGISPPVIVSRDWDGDNNTNPMNPDGDGLPGDEGICVIVVRDFTDGLPDTTYYDRDNDPNNGVPGDDSSVSPNTQGYWWRVISGNNDPDDPFYYTGNGSVWRVDPNDNGSADDDDKIYGSNGYWQYTQHIKVTDSTPPIISATGNDTFCSESNLDCQGVVQYNIDATDNCAPDDNVNITVLLDVNNDGTDLIDVSASLVGNTFRSRYPIGTHRLIFRINDICGGNSSVEKIFEVIDCLAPTPICSQNLIVNLMATEDGILSEIWATDYIISAVGDCTGQGPANVSVGDGVFRPEVTLFSINRKGEPYHPDSAGVTVTCADVNTVVPVEVHAIDESGNHSFCNTFIQVQDNNNLCGSGATQAEIAGAIGTQSGAMVAEVEVNLSGPVSMNYMTDEKGQFSFEDLESGYDYTVSPTKDGDYRNGVTIVDLINVKKHVLGHEFLNSPYSQVAADVNGSGTITVKDLIELQRLILHKIDAFDEVDSWRFVDSKYTFPDGLDAMSKGFPEVVNINNLLRNQLSTDFVAVKMGDTNESAKVSGAQKVEQRSTVDPLLVKLEDQQLKANEVVTLYLNADLSAYQGFQFTLASTNNLEIIDVQSGLLGEDQIGVFAKEGLITAAWYDLDDNKDLKEVQLFGITVRAKTDLSVKDALSISSRLTPAESVKDVHTRPGIVSLDFGQDAASLDQQFTLFGSQPNPFTAETMISFYLPEAGEATITINDVTGRIVKVFNGDYAAGENQLRVTNKDLPQSGVYYFTLKAGDHSDTKRLILVE